MTFKVSGLSAASFAHLFHLSDAELNRNRAKRVTVNGPGFPERIEMRDATPGETLLLVNYEHQPADTPYRASHAVYVREGATATYHAYDSLPEVMTSRLLSLRAFDADHMMIGADVVEGTKAIAVIEKLFADSRVDYIHAHYAKFGCFAAHITRA